MKRFIKLFGVLGMTGCFLLGGMNVYAAEEGFIEIPVEEIQVVAPSGNEEISMTSSDSLAGCSLEIGIASNGVSLTFATRATGTASEIGVKNVVLQEKQPGGGWKSIPISNHYARGTDDYYGGVVYTGAQKGRTYKVSCTHYAIIDGHEYTLNSQTGELVYN